MKAFIIIAAAATISLGFFVFHKVFGARRMIYAPIKKISLNEILDADELFFTGTAAEVVPIRMVDQNLIANGKRGPITTILQKKYFDQVRGKRDSFVEWLTPIE